MKTRLKHICFITRSLKNETVLLDKNAVVERIMNQVYMPRDAAMLQKTLGLINALLQNVSVWEIRCNMDIESAEVAYRAIFNKEPEFLEKTKEEIFVEQKSNTYLATWTPAKDTGKFEIEFPFCPTKIMIFCNDAFVYTQNDDCNYFCNFLIDLTAEPFKVIGLRTGNVVSAFSIKNPKNLFLLINNRFAINEFKINGKVYRFLAGKEYTIVAVG